MTLPRHRDPEALVWLDVMVGVLGVIAQIDSDPVDLAVESAGMRRVVGANGGAGFVADFGGLISREDEALGLVHTSQVRAHLLNGRHYYRLATRRVHLCF